MKIILTKVDSYRQIALGSIFIGVSSTGSVYLGHRDLNRSCEYYTTVLMRYTDEDGNPDLRSTPFYRSHLDGAVAYYRIDDSVTLRDLVTPGNEFVVATPNILCTIP